MRHYGSKSWKPTCLWSNSCHIQKLDLGPLTKEQKDSAETLATSYVDRRGVKRCVGKKKQLKESQSFGCTKLMDTSIQQLLIRFLRDPKHCLLSLFPIFFRVCVSKYVFFPLRSYTKAFGYKLGSIFPDMQSGIRGLRKQKDPTSFCFLVTVSVDW